MGKIWGYEKTPGGMFSKQTIGRGKAERQVLMKLPHVHDMQRLVFAKHLARLNRLDVYTGKMTDPNFEEKLDDYINRAPVQRGGIGRGPGPSLRRRWLTLRKNKTKEKQQNSTVESNSDLQGLNPELMVYKKIQTQNIRVKKTQNEEKDDSNKEKRSISWERTHWRSRFTKDQVSEVMNEVFAMNRMVTQDHQSFSAYQNPLIIYLESSQYALKVHDWPRIALAISGILHLFATDFRCKGAIVNIPTRGRVTPVWLYGLLALGNCYKDRTDLVQTYAGIVRKLFPMYPMWLGVHVAAWLIQKGRFLQAHETLMDHVGGLNPGRLAVYYPEDNLKKRQVLFCIYFIDAVKLYCEWKKEIGILTDYRLNTDDENEALSNSVRRKGEAALAAFETLYQSQRITEVDVMCFLEPLVELLMAYRSTERAFEILQEIHSANEGNLVVEDYFVKFIERYANVCDLSEDYISQLKERWQRKTTYDQQGKPLERLKARRKIKAMRAARKKTGITSGFTKIQNPGFSW